MVKHLRQHKRPPTKAVPVSAQGDGHKKNTPVGNLIFKRAVVFFEQGKFSEASALYKQVLEKNPKDASAWLNLGTALRRMDRSEAAIACCRRALELSPGNSSYLTNYGNALADLEQEQESLDAHAAAARAKPDDFLICRNYAIALRDFRHFDEALVYFDKALRLRPDDVSLQWDRAITYLHLGRFKEGWEAFEVRWKVPPMQERVMSVPRWRGENISGKTVLVYEEQGFGDTILCSRYIPMIAARGGRVILECKKPLHRLFQSVQGIDKIVEVGMIDEVFDYHIPMMSLPGIFKTGLSSIPSPANLCVPDSVQPEVTRLLDFAGGRLKVGVVWSGSVTFPHNRRRAVSAARFLPLTEIPDIQLYSLQKGPCEKELAECGGQGLILELGSFLNDFADTAAILKQLDLVIMTDSAVAHLAGSLGVPIWNLLNFQPYWLYLSEREDSPWYPSMRLFRQPEPGDWDSVFARVAQALEHMIVERDKPQAAKPVKAG